MPSRTLGPINTFPAISFPKAFATIVKRKCDNVSPRLDPLEALKKSNANPLMSENGEGCCRNTLLDPVLPFYSKTHPIHF